MTTSSARPLVSSAKDLIEIGVTIQGVQFFRLEASVNEEVESPAEMPPNIAPVYGLKLRHDGREIGTRVSVTLDSVSWKIIVDASVEYTIDEDVDLADGVLLDFANNVGVMALIPYLRQAIADLSQRVIGEVVLMPIIPRGDLNFTPDDEEPTLLS